MAIASSAIGGNVLALAKAVHQVDALALRGQCLGRRGHARIAGLAQDFAGRRIDRHDAVAVGLHVLGGEETGPVPLRRQADHGDGLAGAEDAAQGGDVGHGAVYAMRAAGAGAGGYSLAMAERSSATPSTSDSTMGGLPFL